MQDWALVIIIGFFGLIGGILGLKFVKYRALDASYVTDKVKRYKEIAEEYKKEASHWKGKFNQYKQKMYVDGDYNIESEDGLLALLSNLGDKVGGLLPDKYGKFLKDPTLIKDGLEFIQKHPEAKQFLTGFIKPTNKSTTPESETPAL